MTEIRDPDSNRVLFTTAELERAIKGQRSASPKPVVMLRTLTIFADLVPSAEHRRPQVYPWMQRLAWPRPVVEALQQAKAQGRIALMHHILDEARRLYFAELQDWPEAPALRQAFVERYDGTRRNRPNNWMAILDWPQGMKAALGRSTRSNSPWRSDDIIDDAWWLYEAERRGHRAAAQHIRTTLTLKYGDSR